MVKTDNEFFEEAERAVNIEYFFTKMGEKINSYGDHEIILMNN